MERAISNARVYQFKIPDDADWWTDFWEHMDHTMEERQDFLWNKMYESGEIEVEFEPDTEIRHPDNIGDMFCDNCEFFKFSLLGKGEACYCGSCWEALGMEDQTGFSDLKDRDMPSTYALVGCGSSKREGELPAREKYKSTYFEKKRDVAEELCDDYRIISAKYGVLHPERVIDDYDVRIDDIELEPFLKDVQQELKEEFCPTRSDTVWVFLGKEYLQRETDSGDSLEKVIERLDWNPRYPFRQTSGIGRQNQFLDQCLKHDELVMPYRLDGFGDGQQTLDSF